MPALVSAFYAAQLVDVAPKLSGFVFTQLTQLPLMAPCLLPAALNDALLGQSVEGVTAEHGGADPAI